MPVYQFWMLNAWLE